MKALHHFAIAAVTAAFLSQAPLALASDMSALPPEQIQNGITYVTGGVGQPESTAMRAAAGQYDLMLTFAKADGAFLSDVGVQIADQRGERYLDVTSGPILLVDLPQGTYNVSATVGDSTQVRTVDVGRHHRQIAYNWPNSIDQASEFAAFEVMPSEQPMGSMTPATPSGSMSGQSASSFWGSDNLSPFFRSYDYQ